MFGFMKSNAARFADWAFPLVMGSDVLARLVEHDSEIPQAVKESFKSWAVSSRESFEVIRFQIENEYGLPELEALRAETCANIIHGHWQSAVCLTSILIEVFLKLALVYTNWDKEEDPSKAFGGIGISVPEAAMKSLGLPLKETIDGAQAHGLIDEDTKIKLHAYRKQFRNAYFHADMKLMHGSKTALFQYIDFGSGRTEGPTAIPIHAVPAIMGEEMWQNARSNAIPYFKEVDALIRETLPKVFPQLNADQGD